MSATEYRNHFVNQSGCSLYLTQRITLVTMQKLKQIIEFIVGFCAVSLIVCEINMAAMTFQKDKVLRWHPNEFSVWFWANAERIFSHRLLQISLTFWLHSVTERRIFVFKRYPELRQSLIFMSEQQSSIIAHFEQTFCFTDINFSCVYIFSERIVHPKVSISRILMFRKIIVKVVS